MANPIFRSPDWASFLLGFSLVEPPNMHRLQTGSLTFFANQSSSADVHQEGSMLQVSTSQIDHFNHLRSGILIYMKASLVVVDCTGVYEQEDCNPAKNQGVEPER